MESQSPKDITDYYKHLSLFWTDIIHLMASKPQALTSIGPMRAFASNSKKISTELIQINENLMEFNKLVTEYYKQLSETWSEAQKKVNLKAPDVPAQVADVAVDPQAGVGVMRRPVASLCQASGPGEVRTTRYARRKRTFSPAGRL